VKLLFVDNQFAPGAAGMLSFNVMAAVAQYYSDNLRTEVIKGMEERAKQGWSVGAASFGYLNVADKSCPIIPHPEKSRTVVRIFDLFSTGQYTLDAIGDKLKEEGHTFRECYPRFNRTALAYILHNRVYIGEVRHGNTSYVASFPPLVSKTTFNICQDVFKGRTRRSANADHPFQGGLFRCAYCGAMMTGERVTRRQKNGKVNKHFYYRCANNNLPEGHPIVRWKAADIDAAIVAELESLRIKDEGHAQLVRNTLVAAFADVAKAEADRRKILLKRKTEIKGRLDRLMNVFLDGGLDQATYSAKQVELKNEQKEVERLLEEKPNIDPKRGQLALKIFDFMQNAAKLWHGSKIEQKRDILTAISLNRQLSDTTLCLTKRSPFDIAAKGRDFDNGRPDWI
jgi:hypothetical protein